MKGFILADAVRKTILEDLEVNQLRTPNPILEKYGLLD